MVYYYQWGEQYPTRISCQVCVCVCVGVCVCLCVRACVCVCGIKVHTTGTNKMVEIKRAVVQIDRQRDRERHGGEWWSLLVEQMGRPEKRTLQ